MHTEKDFLETCNNQLQKWYANANKNNSNMHDNFETDMDLLIGNINQRHKAAKLTSKMVICRYQSNLEILHTFYTTDKHFIKLTEHPEILVKKNFDTHKVPKKKTRKITSTKKKKETKSKGAPRKQRTRGKKTITPNIT